MTPIDTTRDDFVVSLEEYATVPKVVEERIYGWLDVERVKPKCEDAGFAFTFCVKVFYFELFLFGDGVEAWVGIEEVGDKGKIEFGVSSNERCWGEELATIESVGVLKDLLGTLKKIAGLEGAAAANVWGKLIEEHRVVIAFLNIGREIRDSGNQVS